MQNFIPNITFDIIWRLFWSVLPKHILSCIYMFTYSTKVVYFWQGLGHCVWVRVGICLMFLCGFRSLTCWLYYVFSWFLWIHNRCRDCYFQSHPECNSSLSFFFLQQCQETNYEFVFSHFDGAADLCCFFCQVCLSVFSYQNLGDYKVCKSNQTNGNILKLHTVLYCKCENFMCYYTRDYLLSNGRLKQNFGYMCYCQSTVMLPGYFWDEWNMN